MRRTIIQLAIVSTALAVVGPALAAPRSATVTAPTPAPTSATEPTPAAAQTEGLCGLTQADVVDIVDHYGIQPNGSAIAEALEVPFNCEAYGGLCSAVDSAVAETYACGVWEALADHRPIAEIRDEADARLAQWGTWCPPNWGVCHDMCDGDGVLRCAGILVNGVCRQIPLCASHVEIVFFEDLVIDL